MVEVHQLVLEDTPGADDQAAQCGRVGDELVAQGHGILGIQQQARDEGVAQHGVHRGDHRDGDAAPPVGGRVGAIGLGLLGHGQLLRLTITVLSS